MWSSLRRIAAQAFGLCSLSAAFAQKQDYVQYVNTLQGTDLKFELSYGNTYKHDRHALRDAHLGRIDRPQRRRLEIPVLGR